MSNRIQLEARGHVFSFDNYVEQAHEISNIKRFYQEWNAESDTIEAQSSGSTGDPKRIFLKKRFMQASARMTGEVFDLKPGDRVLCPLSAGFIAGKMMLVRSMELGLDLCYGPIQSNPLAGINDCQFAFAVMTPHQLTQVLLDKSTRAKLDDVQCLLLGGGPVNADLAQQIMGLRTKVYHGYGMTETMSHVALRFMHDAVADDIFHACPNVDFSVDDRSCLVINASFLGVEQLVTNDLVNLLDAKSYQWLGRWDDVINSGGIKLHPSKLESKIKEFINVPFYIVGMPDLKYGERPCLFLETSKSISIESLRLQLESKLDRIEMPKEIRCVESFTYTSNGKMKRIYFD